MEHLTKLIKTEELFEYEKLLDIFRSVGLLPAIQINTYAEKKTHTNGL